MLTRSCRAISTLSWCPLGWVAKSISRQHTASSASLTNRSARAASVSERSSARSPSRPRRASFPASQSRKSSAPIFHRLRTSIGSCGSSRACSIIRSNSRRFFTVSSIRPCSPNSRSTRSHFARNFGRRYAGKLLHRYDSNFWSAEISPARLGLR